MAYSGKNEVIANILHSAADKRLYIWGLGVYGLSLLSELLYYGIKVAGIVDKRGRELVGGDTYHGIPILEPKNIVLGEDSYMICTATKPQSIKEIYGIINQAGGDGVLC